MTGNSYGETVLGHIIQVAPAWLLLGVAVALYGFLPQAVGAVWVLFGYGAFMSLFGQMLQLGSPWQDFSPFSHVGQYPGAEISWSSFAALAALSAAAFLVGALGFDGAISSRRRPHFPAAIVIAIHIHSVTL